MDTLISRLNRIPPCVCRLIARKRRGRRPLSIEEISERSGLAKSTVHKLSQKKDWKGITIDVIEAFSLACGVNHLKMAGQLDYIKRSKMGHIQNGHSQQKKMFARMFNQ